MHKHPLCFWRRAVFPILAAALLCLSGCGDGERGMTTSTDGPAPTPPQEESSQAGETPPPAEGYTVTAMYIPLGRKDPPESYLMFDQKDDSAFTLGVFPEDIRDLSGNPITRAGLKEGDLVEIDFGPDSYMLTIYPSISHGATAVRVVKEGEPGDADRYQGAVAQFYDPQPQKPPVLQFDYQEMFLESAVSCGGSQQASSYEWHYEDLEGNPGVASAENPPAIQQDSLNDLELEEPVDLTLSLNEEPVEWAVLRWKEEYLGTSNAPEGEPVALEDDGRGGKTIPGAEPGWVYQVTAHWEESWVEYGFLT